jgi:hypothetical protein
MQSVRTILRPTSTSHSEKFLRNAKTLYKLTAYTTVHIHRMIIITLVIPRPDCSWSTRTTVSQVSLIPICPISFPFCRLLRFSNSFCESAQQIKLELLHDMRVIHSVLTPSTKVEVFTENHVSKINLKNLREEESEMMPSCYYVLPQGHIRDIDFQAR